MRPYATLQDGERTPLALWTVRHLIWRGPDWWWYTLTLQSYS